MTQRAVKWLKSTNRNWLKSTRSGPKAKTNTGWPYILLRANEKAWVIPATDSRHYSCR